MNRKKNEMVERFDSQLVEYWIQKTLCISHMETWYKTIFYEYTNVSFGMVLVHYMFESKADLKK